MLKGVINPGEAAEVYSLIARYVATDEERQAWVPEANKGIREHHGQNSESLSRTGARVAAPSSRSCSTKAASEAIHELSGPL